MNLSQFVSNQSSSGVSLSEYNSFKSTTQTSLAQKAEVSETYNKDTIDSTIKRMKVASLLFN